jgi:hypothetical protein
MDLARILPFSRKVEAQAGTLASPIDRVISFS